MPSVEPMNLLPNQETAMSTNTPATNASFGPLKQVEAGVLEVGYVEAGPAGGPAVLLLHGWPYDIHSYAEVTPLLAAAGYRVIVPYLRGYGTTRFLSEAMFLDFRVTRLLMPRPGGRR
jgi:pimeloyl-ACP methyl ester carboxylesterase